MRASHPDGTSPSPRPARLRRRAGAGLKWAGALLFASLAAPAGAVLQVVEDNGTTYSLFLRVGSASGVDTVTFNVAGNQAGLAMTPVAGASSQPIDVYVTPVRNVSTDGTSSTARTVSLRVDSSAGLACQTASTCGSTVIPFTQISWTSNSSDSGDIGSGAFTGSTNQEIARFNANATTCTSFSIFGWCFLWAYNYQTRQMNATRMTFSYANSAVYPAGTYRGRVVFTASTL